MVDWYPLSKVRVQSRNSLTYRTDWTLGSLNVPRGGSQEVENYWQHVNTTIADTILNNPITTNGSQIDKLFLLGESSKHAKFKSVVQDTMLQLRPKLPVIFDDDVVYAAAKGAAETAKRAGDLAVLQRESERTEQRTKNQVYRCCSCPSIPTSSWFYKSYDCGHGEPCFWQSGGFGYPCDHSEIFYSR